MIEITIKMADGNRERIMDHMKQNKPLTRDDLVSFLTTDIMQLSYVMVDDQNAGFTVHKTEDGIDVYKWSNNLF